MLEVVEVDDHTASHALGEKPHRGETLGPHQIKSVSAQRLRDRAPLLGLLPLEQDRIPGMTVADLALDPTPERRKLQVTMACSGIPSEKVYLAEEVSERSGIRWRVTGGDLRKYRDLADSHQRAQ